MTFTQNLQALIKKALRQVANEFNFALPEDVQVKLERPRDPNHGDWATNIAMQLAKKMGTSPRELAEKIIELVKNDELIKSASVAGPGFMNFFLSSSWIKETISTVLTKRNDWGKCNIGNGKKVQVEFVSANPTGPLHMGHGRGAAVGDITANILAFAGYDVCREYYINDAGLQMELLGRSVRAKYFAHFGKADLAPLPEDGYQGDYIVEVANVLVDKYNDSLLTVEEEESIKIFSQEAGYYILNSLIKKDLEDFGVHFDVYYSEKSLYENNLVYPAVEILRQRGFAYEQDGATWFRSTEFGDDKDRVLIRANGVPTYFTSDIAYLKTKYDRGFERNIYVWGADHHGYVPRIRSANKALGFADDGIEVLLIQMVNLVRDGVPVQMSKRAGTIVTLKEIVEEVGRDAARLFFVLRRCDSTVDFDLELAKKASSENPVYYIQYAHARISSIKRELQARGMSMPEITDIDIATLEDETSIALAKAISRFPEEIALAAREAAPHKIVYYATSLAEAFHAFYNSCKIIGSPDNVTKSRLLLMEATQITLRNAMSILGISAPERM
ncbi:MAG: arginine--tRNA ligase [Synergistaceae bacterium]|nr:arginine--tRNA ligase [Synergistaceae bacterium]